jgi:hypothetical protein
MDEVASEADTIFHLAPAVGVKPIVEQHCPLECC